MLHHHSPRPRPSTGHAPGGSLIDVRQVVKSYSSASGSFTALNGVSLQVQAGEFVAVVGKSGSGKSTLINLIAGIDRPTSGEVDGRRHRRPCAQRGAAGGLARAQRRRRLPVLPAAADPDGRRERDAADGLLQHVPGRRAPRRAPCACWSASASPTRPTSCRRRCPAASSSAPRSPARWPTIHR